LPEGRREEGPVRAKTRVVLATATLLAAAGAGTAIAQEPSLCGGLVPTIVGTAGPDVLHGTAGPVDGFGGIGPMSDCVPVSQSID
jgi:hypothetical protein